MLTFKLFVSLFPQPPFAHTIVEQSPASCDESCFSSSFSYSSCSILFASSCTFSCCTVWRNYNWSEVMNEFQFLSGFLPFPGHNEHVNRQTMALKCECGLSHKLHHNFITLLCSARDRLNVVSKSNANAMSSSPPANFQLN